MNTVERKKTKKTTIFFSFSFNQAILCQIQPFVERENVKSLFSVGIGVKREEEEEEERNLLLLGVQSRPCHKSITISHKTLKPTNYVYKNKSFQPRFSYEASINFLWSLKQLFYWVRVMETRPFFRSPSWISAGKIFAKQKNPHKMVV